MDVTELAPSTPLARIEAKAGKVSSGLAFKVENKRNIVLMAKRGGCTVSILKVR